MKYRYYINDVEVYPKGEWTIEYRRNEGQIFFRRIFEGELTFMGADYTFIKSLCCDIATFDIWCGGAIHWEGQFQYPYKAKFDDDSCTVVLTPEVVDEYSCIMGHYDIQVSLFPTGSVIVIEDCATTNPFTIQAGRYAARLIATTASGNANYINQLINGSVQGPVCGLTISSSFFCESDFPNGDNYAGAYGGNNYITGAANRLDLIYIVPNDGLRVSAFGAGTGCDGYPTLSFKDLEDLLRMAFNAYWFIDENGDFRVEHIYYFDPAFANSDYTVGIDLQTVMDRGGRSFAYRRNKYEYETGRMYDQERWSWQHYEGTEAGSPHGIDFEGYPIFYGTAENQKSVYVPGDFKEKKMDLPKFWTDGTWLQAMIAGTGVPEDIECNGWFVMDITGGTIRCENGIVSGVPEVNGHLATTRLHDNYHRYDRIFNQGNMNSAAEIFLTAQKHKLQDPIEFPLCCDETFDPLNRIRTGLGDGEVKAAIQKKQSLEVELWHEFDCTELELCIEENQRMCFDGVNDTVLLSGVPEFTGNKIIEFCCFLPSAQDYTGTNNDVLMHFRNGTDSDYFAAYMLDIGAGSLMNIQVSVTATNNRRIDVTPYIGAPLHVEVSKGAETINYIKFNGNLVTGASGSGMGFSNTRNIGYTTGSGTAGYYFYGSIWDIILQGVHWWKGYPAGNTDAAWVDQIGAIDGTVSGSPALWPC